MDFYDNTEAIEILSGDSIHLGFWPEGESDLPLSEAQDRLTDLVIGNLGVRAGARVLDVGCGTGGPARRVARATGASVTGVTISERQAEVAAARSLAHGLQAQTRFQVADATVLPFADEDFDGVLALESIVHMPEAARTLREILRVLRPGGALVIADMSLVPGAISPSDVFAPPLSLAAPLTLDGYRQLVSDAGFDVEDVLDISKQTKATYARWRERLIERRTDLLSVASAELIDGLEEHFRLFDIAAAEGGAVGYLLIAARKRESP